jgi:hypothetical protein
MTTTPFLGLELYTLASGSLTKVIDWRASISGTAGNDAKIDAWASGISGSVAGLLSSYGISPISGSMVTSGSGATYYEADSSTLTSYSNGVMIEFIPNTTSSGSVTANINGLGVRSFYKQNSDGTQSYLAPGDLLSYKGYLFRYSEVNSAWIADFALIGYNYPGHLIQKDSGSTIVQPILDIKSGSNVTVDYVNSASGSSIVLTISALPSGSISGLSIGTTENNTHFESDGTLVFSGSATVYKDLIIAANNLKPGASDPTFAAFVDNIYEYRFDDGGTDELHGAVELQHDYKEGSDMEVHIHWSPTTTNVGGVAWRFDYTVANMTSGSFPSSVTLTPISGSYTSGSVNLHQYTTLGTISNPTLKIGAVIAFRIYRLGGDASDTFTGNAFLHSLGVHYEIDTCGSRSRASK